MSDDPDNVTMLICGPDGLCSLCAGEDRSGTDGCGSYFHLTAERQVNTSECPGCIGRGLGTVCEMCGQPIPEHLIRRPSGPVDNPALDGYAFATTLDLIRRTR